MRKKPPFVILNIETETIVNKNYRHIIFTGRNLQLVLMSIKPGEEIGKEVHDDVDQFFRVEKGVGMLVVGKGRSYELHDGDAFVIPAGTEHNIMNESKKQHLKLYTIYAPPEHDPVKEGFIQKNKPKHD